jgi:hypothetical protein
VFDFNKSKFVKEFRLFSFYWSSNNNLLYGQKSFNLFTGANKSSYIDWFLERSVNAGDVVRNLAIAL